MNKFRSSHLLLLTCAVLLLGACVQSGSGGSGTLNLEQQVQQHDMQLKQLQPAQADAWNQLQAIRQELNVLKGQMDDLQNVGGARALVERVNRHDAALRQVETSMALNLNLGDQLPAAPASAPMAAPQIVPMSGMSGGTGYGQSAQGGMPAGSPGYAAAVPEGTQPYQNGAAGQTQPAQAPAASTWGQPSPQPVAQAPQKDISLALFDAGVNAYNARKYEEAQRSFTDFLKNYKDHNLAPEAQYYLAECYFQRNQFADAALAYDTVIKKYSKSSHAPGAYLKQGISFSKLNQGAAAKARMQELIKMFPNSPEAARAKSFLKTNK
ncbi:tol-pal system protein YbgF [uncultured Desulfovibrio sp.]|uniref:tol-pal system protein YbgF n=1 Tax=uncultured Desulfovibrio sp. TaxID=167968 RepID=UPI002610D2C3|nr:tol-pal system protein YbgF [uncultured Desulfovibrio sp.]